MNSITFKGLWYLNEGIKGDLDSSLENLCLEFNYFDCKLKKDENEFQAAVNSFADAVSTHSNITLLSL